MKLWDPAKQNQDVFLKVFPGPHGIKNVPRLRRTSLFSGPTKVAGNVACEFCGLLKEHLRRTTTRNKLLGEGV